MYVCCLYFNIWKFLNRSKPSGMSTQYRDEAQLSGDASFKPGETKYGVGERIFASTSRYNILALLACLHAALLFSIDLMYRGKNESMFEAHPIISKVAVGSLLAYGFTYGVEFSFINCLLLAGACFVRSSMIYFGSLSVASLVSVLYPNSAAVLYTICTLLPFVAHGLLRRLWSKQVKRTLWFRATVEGKWKMKEERETGSKKLVCLWVNVFDEKQFLLFNGLSQCFYVVWRDMNSEYTLIYVKKKWSKKWGKWFVDKWRWRWKRGLYLFIYFLFYFCSNF